MKKIVATVTAAGAVSLGLLFPAASQAAKDNCSHSLRSDDECEVLVDYYSYDFCMTGGEQDLSEEDFRGYRYFDCIQTANGSWHILMHNG
ncbi:hypothetical protein [Segniliparus rugosus]|uniref:Uncharacterized protein n=1 Tax=Segniliparus rugosus (strain ATCC BAA-974 / DSM 45345 / CCUG 50838 / CIP 108380 / JCM 13579 / CDC 945) TaxID=679197 RepID=E5XM30_SEGRC|nr:hypothetical protein [Segniliparus rugosus]EFV14591.2 hypothetical protein HMPREF9336_00549 [Segniliparus rugosus ATCC BAA-974]